MRDPHAGKYGESTPSRQRGGGGFGLPLTHKHHLPAVEAERGTEAWFALRLGPSTFAIFDAFPDDSGLRAHLAGDVARELLARAPELFTEPPDADRADVIAAKLPH